MCFVSQVGGQVAAGTAPHSAEEGSSEVECAVTFPVDYRRDCRKTLGGVVLKKAGEEGGMRGAATMAGMGDDLTIQWSASASASKAERLE